jgi:enoyl-CoA hydratase/carnithine racemase
LSDLGDFQKWQKLKHRFTNRTRRRTGTVSRAQDGIAFLTLNDPPANTYTYEMMQALDSAILRARMDEGVQVIVITGHGEKFFSAGANINMLANVTPNVQILLLPARQRNVIPARTNSQAGDCSNQRPLCWRRI